MLAVLTRFCRLRCEDTLRCIEREDEFAKASQRKSCRTESKVLLRLKKVTETRKYCLMFKELN